MYNFKKFVALGMVATMILGSSLTAFADDPAEGAAVEVTGAGASAFVDKDVFVITVPTGDALTNTIAFTVDPYGVVAEANSDKKVEEGAGVLFASTSEEYDYAATSDALTITNKGSIGITLDIVAKVVPGTATYAGGYSTTSDFSGGATAGADAATGLYLALLADNEAPKALSATEVTFTNAAISAADQYEVKKASGGGYEYAIKSGAEDFPTYEFKVTGALNNNVAETTWYTVNSSTHEKTAKTMPSLSVKFTPNAIRECKAATVSVEGDDFYISKATEEGGFGTTAPTAILVNGKSVATVADNVDGYAHVTWENVYKAWGFTKEEDIPEGYVDVIYNGVKNFKVTIGSGDNAVSYYAEIK